MSFPQDDKQGKIRELSTPLTAKALKDVVYYVWSIGDEKVTSMALNKTAVSIFGTIQSTYFSTDFL